MELGQDRKIASLTFNFYVHLFCEVNSMNEKYMLEALKEAKKANKINDIPVGAIIVYNDKIIARSHNMKNKNSSVLQHAELMAIEKASKKIGDWRLNECEIYVTLEPCPMCASAIQQARIKKLVYGASSNIKDNSLIIKRILNNKNLNHQVEVVKNILDKECSNLLNEFFQKLRK